MSTLGTTDLAVLRPDPAGLRPELSELRPHPAGLRPDLDGLRPDPAVLRPDPAGLWPGSVSRERRRFDLGRLDRRGRVVLAVAVAGTVLVNALVGWAYLQGAPPVRSAPAVEMTLRALSQSSSGAQARPGTTMDLTVTVTNAGSFPLRIVAVRPGPGPVTVDAEHRRAGCRVTGVAVAAAVLPVAWEVSKGTTGVFTVPDGVRRPAGSPAACLGAVFSVPVRAHSAGAGE